MYKSAGSAMKREPNSNSNSASSMNTSSNSNNRSARSKNTSSNSNNRSVRSKNTGSFQTADSGGSLGFNGGQGLGNNNNSVNGPQESSNGTFVTAMSPRTAIRYNTAKSAEARRLKQPVPPQLLNKFRKNVQDLGRNIPRDSGAKISKILKSGAVTGENYVTLQQILKNAREAARNRAAREGAARAAFARERKRSFKQTQTGKSKEKMRSAARKIQGRGRQGILNVLRASEAKTPSPPPKAKTPPKVNVVSPGNFKPKHTIKNMQRILSNKGKKSNLGTRSRQPYIQALINIGLTKQELKCMEPATATVTKTPRTATATGRKRRRPMTATGTKTPGSATAPVTKFQRTAAQGAEKFVSKKQKLMKNVSNRNNLSSIQKEQLMKTINAIRNERTLNKFTINEEIQLNTRRKNLDNRVNKSSMTNAMKRIFSQKIMTTRNINALEKEFNALEKKSKGGNKTSKARALVKLYKSKITSRDLITDNMEKMFANEITQYNISMGRLSTKSDVTIDTFVNMLLIMWLDGIHDKYITMTFKEWLDHQNIQSTFPSKRYTDSPMFTFLKILRARIEKNPKRLQLINANNKNAQLKDVLNGYLKWIFDKENQILKVTRTTKTFTETFINNLGFTPNSTFKPFQAGWEKNFKNFLIEKYREKGNIVEDVKKIKAKNDKDIFLLAIDQEYSTREERPLTKIITGSEKSVQPLVTYGQAFDPGSTMLPKGIVTDLNNITVYVLDPENQKLVKEKATFFPEPWYYLEDYKFTMTVSNLNVMEIIFKTQTSVLQLNGKPLPLTVTGGNAGKSNDPFFQLGKYFGDGLQYFIASGLTKNKASGIQLEGNNDKTMFHPFLGSGDGMALFGYDFVCTQLYKSKAPNMVIDFSGQSKPLAHVVNFPSQSFTVEKVTPAEKKAIANKQYNGNRSTQQAQTSNNTRQGGNTRNTARSKRT